MNASGPSLDQFQAGKVTIDSAELSGRIGVDAGATVAYTEEHGFKLTWWFLPDPHGPPTQMRQLDEADLAALLGKVKATLADPPVTVDVTALEAFKNIVEAHLARDSTLFRNVRFGQAVEEVFGGAKTVTGHIGLGIDVAGTVHEAAGVVSWEHHVVPLPPGPFRPLTLGERHALAGALKAFLKDHEDPAWQTILAALGTE